MYSRTHVRQVKRKSFENEQTKEREHAPTWTRERRRVLPVYVSKGTLNTDANLLAPSMSAEQQDE